MAQSPTKMDLIGQARGGRKLMAIVHADVAGYSRLIGLNDAGTLRRLRMLRRSLIDRTIREFGGQVLQTAGDSLLIVFDSIDGAVRCAIQVQQQVPIHDAEQPSDRQIRYRVGINIGDAIADGTDLHGEGVNVAARLQTVCPIGGICISRAVYDHVHQRLNLDFEPIGALSLKNIARPVEAFVLRLDAAGSPVVNAKPFWARPWVLVGMPVLLASGAAGIVWWEHSISVPSSAIQLVQSAPNTPFAPPEVGLSHAPRLSIVVLPFENFSGDPSQDYLADGIVEDLTTDLARIPGMLVIARNSAFTYKGRAVDVRRVGEELGVRYVLEGSVRKVNEALRINAQLISTETGIHLWADRFDVALRTLGGGQDEIVGRIGAAMNVTLMDIESARSTRERPTNPDAFDFVLQARALENRTTDSEQQKKVIALYERALLLDPASVEAMSGLANALIDTLTVYNEPVSDQLERAEHLVVASEAIRPSALLVLWDRAYLLRARGRWQEATLAFQKLLDAYPNDGGAHFLLGICYLNLGRAAEAIPEYERSMRLDPRWAGIWTRYGRMAQATLFLGRYDEAIDWARRNLAALANPAPQTRAYRYSYIAAAYALSGRLADAHAAMTEATRVWPFMTVRSWWGSDVANQILAEQLDRVMEGLRLAGLRDHADESADFGVPPDTDLHPDGQARTPTTAPGVMTVSTAQLNILLAQRKPLVLDTTAWGSSIAGAIGLESAGNGGSLSDTSQDRLRRKMQELTLGNTSSPVVTVGWNAESYAGRNLAIRLVKIGYTEVFWYRGGREAWEAGGLPETALDVQSW